MARMEKVAALTLALASIASTPAAAEHSVTAALTSLINSQTTTAPAAAPPVAAAPAPVPNPVVGFIPDPVYCKDADLKVENRNDEECFNAGEGLCRIGQDYYGESWFFGLTEPQAGGTDALTLWSAVSGPTDGRATFSNFGDADKLCVGADRGNASYLYLQGSTLRACGNTNRIVKGRDHLKCPDVGSSNTFPKLFLDSDPNEENILKFKDGPPRYDLLWTVTKSGESKTNPGCQWSFIPDGGYPPVYYSSISSRNSACVGIPQPKPGSPTKQPTNQPTVGFLLPGTSPNRRTPTVSPTKKPTGILPILPTGAVSTFDDLKNRIVSAATNRRSPLRIELAPGKISFTEFIGIESKYFDISCPADKTCILDTRDYGFKSARADSLNISFTNVFFDGSGSGNSGTKYGAVHVMGSNPDNAKVRFTGCNFSGLRANDFGGAYYGRDADTAITDCIFDNNSAGTEGGAIAIYQGKSAITKSFIYSNKVTSSAPSTDDASAGIWVFHEKGTDHLIRETVFKGNVRSNGTTAQDAYADLTEFKPISSQASITCGGSGNLNNFCNASFSSGRITTTSSTYGNICPSASARGLTSTSNPTAQCPIATLSEFDNSLKAGAGSSTSPRQFYLAPGKIKLTTDITCGTSIGSRYSCPTGKVCTIDLNQKHISCPSSNIKFDNVVFMNGKSTAKGGAFELTKPTTLGGEADFVNCIFRNCEAVTEGGAIYSKGVGVDIQGSKFFDNKVTGTTGNGGAISADNGRVDIKTSKFIRNAAPQLGGGIYVYNSTPTTTPTTTPVTVRVTGTSFKDNKIYTNVFNDIWNTSDDITVTCSSTTNRFCDAPGDGKNLITTNNPQNLCAGSQAGFLTSACTV